LAALRVPDFRKLDHRRWEHKLARWKRTASSELCPSDEELDNDAANESGAAAGGETDSAGS